MADYGGKPFKWKLFSKNGDKLTFIYHFIQMIENNLFSPNYMMRVGLGMFWLFCVRID